MEDIVGWEADMGQDIVDLSCYTCRHPRSGDRLWGLWRGGVCCVHRDCGRLGFLYAIQAFLVLGMLIEHKGITNTPRTGRTKSCVCWGSRIKMTRAMVANIADGMGSAVVLLSPRHPLHSKEIRETFEFIKYLIVGVIELLRLVCKRGREIAFRAHDPSNVTGKTLE